MSNPSLLISVLVAVLLPTQSLAGDRLLFQQEGPRNGSMPDFSIVVGLISETTRDTIYVSPATYSGIVSLVSNVGSHTVKPDAQVFLVTEFKNSKRKTALFIADKAVGDIARRVIKVCEADRQPVPILISEIAATIPQK